MGSYSNKEIWDKVSAVISGDIINSEFDYHEAFAADDEFKDDILESTRVFLDMDDRGEISLGDDLIINAVESALFAYWTENS